MSTKIIFPILNKNITTFKGPTWYLSENISIETISNEDQGLIFSTAQNEYQALLTPKSKCIRIENINPTDSKSICFTEMSKVSFLLNYFQNAHPIALSFAVQITKKRKAIIDNIIDLPVTSDVFLHAKLPYKIQDNVRRDIISQFYKVIDQVHQQHPGILLTLDRFNSALYRVLPHDKIIDITIALESLIRGSTELRNRFALYNSWAATDDPAERKTHFKLLTDLYDARSEIVHGTSMSENEYQRKIMPIINNFNLIIHVTKRILGYHLLYLYQNNIDSWYEHQQNLALGIDTRQVY